MNKTHRPEDIKKYWQVAVFSDAAGKFSEETNYKLIQQYIDGYENASKTLSSHSFGKGENKKYFILIDEEEAPEGSELFDALKLLDNAEVKFIAELYITGRLVNW